MAGETGKCGNCNCPAGTCAKEGSTESFYSVGGENGKCGAKCNCPAGTCAKEGSSDSLSVAGETGKCGANCDCPAGTHIKFHFFNWVKISSIYSIKYNDVLFRNSRFVGNLTCRSFA